MLQHVPAELRRLYAVAILADRRTHTAWHLMFPVPETSNEMDHLAATREALRPLVEAGHVLIVNRAQLQSRANGIGLAQYQLAYRAEPNGQPA